MQASNTACNRPCICISTDIYISIFVSNTNRTRCFTLRVRLRLTASTACPESEPLPASSCKSWFAASATLTGVSALRVKNGVTRNQKVAGALLVHRLQKRSNTASLVATRIRMENLAFHLEDAAKSAKTIIFTYSSAIRIHL